MEAEADLLHLPEEKRALLERLVNELSRVPGMAAVVLGGSYASGTQHPGSDLDIGLYYFETRPFPIAEIRRIAGDVSSTGSATVTEFYEWGAWVNGGAWIVTPYGKVDFLYRNLDQVRRTISEAQEGITHHDYDQQPAHGFYSVIYLAETQICVPLFDPGGLIADLKRQIEPYPAALKEKIVADSLWAAEFTLLHARDFAAQDDVYNTAGCIARVTANLTQALFAVNKRYFIRDKRVMETIAGFPCLPAAYVKRVHRIVAHPGHTARELIATVQALEEVWQSVVALAGDRYEPRFVIVRQPQRSDPGHPKGDAQSRALPDQETSPAPQIATVTLVVHDYDEAIAFFTEALAFRVIEDTPLGGGKRWVRVAPARSNGTSLLLALAASPEQRDRVGDQTGGRVFLFLETPDFWTDYEAMRRHGVRFAEEPRRETYGWVAVFFDLYGNRWDLLQAGADSI